MKGFTMGERATTCNLCQRAYPYIAGLIRFDGFSLCKDGHRINLCCPGCKRDFLALPDKEMQAVIRAACEQAFPPHQVIYVERDPRTQQPRYIGRTHNAARRHAEHVRHATKFEGGFYQGAQGELIPIPYTRKHWIYDLKQLGLKPIQEILMSVEIAPQVMEWETRWILHAIQQEWPILNKEAITSGYAKRVGTIDFLHVPLDDLIEGKFIRGQGIEAFVREWYEEPSEDWMDDKFDVDFPTWTMTPGTIRRVEAL